MQNGKVTIGLIQMRVEDDREAMLKKALARVEEAVKAGADIICLPELYRTRYFPQHIGRVHPFFLKDCKGTPGCHHRPVV
jgi:predicted amidohydrolase